MSIFGAISFDQIVLAIIVTMMLHEAMGILPKGRKLCLQRPRLSSKSQGKS
ncbi:MAG: hypothetical protein P8X50_02445 [Maritimibacter sp.]|jgi:hypothetical protein